MSDPHPGMRFEGDNEELFALGVPQGSSEELAVLGGPPTGLQVQRVDNCFSLYWETQLGRQCGLQCLNNLLQAPTFSKQELDELAMKISLELAMLEYGSTRAQVVERDWCGTVASSLLGFEIEVSEGCGRLLRPTWPRVRIWTARRNV